MNVSQVVVQGTLKSDGTLELDEKPDLPPGRVQVTLQAEAGAPQGRSGYWEVLQQIWKEQAETGRKPRSREDIDAEIDDLREGWEERMRELDRIPEDRQREKPGC
jgi:hypothetical protein